MILRKMKGLVSMLLIISIVLSTILVTNGETLEETVLSETADLIADEPSPGPVPQNILYAYAETEQPPFIFGDLNGDNKVNSTDYSLLKRFLLEIVENFTSPYGLTAADLNLDSRVNSTDYTIMKRYLLELVDQLPFTNKTNSVIAAANYAELRDRLSEEVKKKVEIVVAAYSGVTDSLDQNVVAIVNDILGQTGISGTVNSSSFRIEGKTGSMAIIFSFEYNQSSITDLEQLKESIRAGMKEFQTTVEIPIGTNVNEVTQSLGEIIESILSEEEYLNRKCKSYSANLRSNGDAYNLILNFEYYTTKEQEDELTEKIKEILSVIIKPNMDDDQREKEIHDYIVSRIKYDYEFKNRTAYDALMTGKVTCDGYSELTLRMLGEAGIESKIVTSSDHAWNLVRIGDHWFHVDCTWNAGIYEQTKEIVYNYYNLTDKESPDIIVGIPGTILLQT